MSDLHKALGDISSIRRQMAQSAEFRGYGPATLATTAAIALAAAQLQSIRIADPAAHLSAYLTLWLATAVLGASVLAVQTWRRTRRIHTGMADEMLRQAIEQFLPAVLAGALLTFVLVRFAPHAAWMLPGLWQIVYALGVFSSCRFLPRQMLVAGAWFLLTGLVCLSLGDARALAPWAMGIPYGVGQLLVAAVLWSTREPADEA